MKLSSISLTAAAITAILGCAIAVPVALHPVDLKEVNPFKRGVAALEWEVDGEPADYLFTRNDHETAADPFLQAANACCATAKKWREASKHPKLESEAKEECLRNADDYDKQYELFKKKSQKYLANPMSGVAHTDACGANLWVEFAKESGEAAEAISHRSG